MSELKVWMLIAVMAVCVIAVAAQVEKAPVKEDECQWIYDKAYTMAITANDLPDTSTERQMSEMWSQLYVACKTKNRR